jgi:threonine/homoserine/homoserine lactone efflux protein
MTPVTALFAIAGALLIGVVSPGPSFIIVARTAVARSRRDGLLASIGMGVGGVVFAVIAMAGLYAILSTVTWLYTGLKIVGGLYLVYLAVKIWRGSSHPLSTDPVGQVRTAGAFRLGLTTQLSNPKTAIVYGSIFAALLPHPTPVWWYVVVPPVAFTIEAGWYSIVAVGFSAQRPRAAYARAKKWIDRVAAGAIGLLGVRLVVTAPETGV